MKKSTRRVPINLILCLAALLGGAGLGYAVGFFEALHVMQQTLLRYALQRSISTDRYPREGLQMLAQMNASSLAPCSDAELDSFRALILNSHYVKDAGRMSGQRLVCSATFPAANLPGKTYTPSFTEAAGDQLYVDIEALHVGPYTPIVIRKGDLYVALDPYKRDDIPADILFAVTMKNAPSGGSNRLGGAALPGSNNDFRTDSHGRAGDYLYATKCSDLFSGCVTAYVSIRQALRDQRQVPRVGSAAGCLIGACFYLAFILAARRKQGIEHQLRRAIAQGRLRVVYQPLVDLITREVVGGEALIRWTDEDGLVISPDVLIKIAEDRGFVTRITKLVVQHSLEDFGSHMDQHPEFRLNVNISGHDLSDPAFLPMIEESLLRAGVMATSLAIELTETATAMREMAIDAIAQLRLRGHAVYIDDFGTGYSSLAYLRDLSVTGIKIDKSFTKTIGTESVTEGILPQVLAMAQALGLDVIAEGIETEAQYAYYKETSMSLTAQGWLFGHALPPEDFREQWLSAEKSHPVSAGQE